MAITEENLYVLCIILGSFSFILQRHSCNAHSLASCHFDSIYQFGDSFSDTGNLAILAPKVPCNRPPYGISLPNKAPGRCSDGLLIIDYIAQAAGLSFIEPFQNNNATHSSGVNFAVAGAPASSLYEVQDQSMHVPALSDQLDLFARYYNATSCSQDRYRLKMSLFIVGQIGLNDYNNAIIHGNKTFEEVKNMVVNVVQAIKDAIERVIGYGAVKILVPGQWPIGCLPVYLIRFSSNDTAAYDQFYCLTEWNSISESHNYHLINAIEELKKEHPNVTIVYADYYGTFEWLLTQRQELGFDVVDKLCCGVKGEADTDEAKACGISPDVHLCANPEKLISWDGVHMTQQVHKYIAQQLIRDILPNLDCGKSCK
ncbi:GDSL esterase/lipase At5g03980-like [Argentina anserina]|uniref:GDSL esterase/lipase At5g03980-like n=1 Tax=Argentina anserina TaxID=57926 RepID=UPI00217636B9|nr:GDSL esterase/lipase At5g03980-like [Potentilla anserina]